MDSSPDDFVSHALRRLPEPPMPDWVEGRLSAVFATEVARRNRGDAALEAEQHDVEIAQRGSLGTYGVNAPTHFDKAGLGLVEPHTTGSAATSHR